MAELQYLVFRIAMNKIAINLEHVLEVIRMPNWTPYPNSSDFLKGIFNLRNNIIPLIDFRKLLSFPTFDDEINDLIEMLKMREHDHINWLNELELCVTEKREFRLNTDPHKCKFGEWYYTYKTENVVLQNLLEQFERPHNQIHSRGIEVNNLLLHKKYDDAERVVLDARNLEFARMVNLFNELYNILKTTMREFVVIINTDAGMKSFTVDKIDKIMKITENDIYKLDNSELQGTVNEVIRINEDIILKLNIQSLLEKI